MNNFFEDQCKLLRSYICSPNISLKKTDLEIISRIFDENLLLNNNKCSASTSLKSCRNFYSGEIEEFVEIVSQYIDANPKNSNVLLRAPAPEDSIRGNPMNFPFLPGGFDEEIFDFENISQENVNIFNDINEPRFETPPGFWQGYKFNEESEIAKGENSINLLSALEKDLDVSAWLDCTNKDINERIKDNVNVNTKRASDTLSEVLESVPTLKISHCQNEILYSSEWAEKVDTEKLITNFKEKVPMPALEFDFELDNFQKQAIIKLEEHKNVFISAHTSAGKTVIAEYAIALSQKHLSKSIYTSPIKALSNQKYRDFKKKFNDVGLITGDLQIEPTASCLIMTTEILRSMLFGGSEVIRDIDYVIFDEVHYINDLDRGHVWEEVIMLLPNDIKIIMLSATVPNVIELAEWVGMIKKKKVYVISTLKRPVPLEHYLYVDSGGRQKENMHLIVNSNSQFLVSNYNSVKKQIDQRISKKNTGKFSTAKEEQRQWINLIDHLQKKEKLPVIAFTLNRNRCDTNAIALKDRDLITEKEKAAVHNFFQQRLAILKPEDRILKQVLLIKELLEHGIGIHHSGILPFLKEIVEMAFLDGWVKVLFATETFAMGVNMPARSVVFDSYKKHDGTELRYLKPSEYTQMAGRAGRRGHDETGTVILFCKQNLPSEVELKNIILGKPDLLLSKFRLRYAAILKCLCLQNITVEDMMKHSFKEFNFKKTSPSNLQLLQERKDKLSKINLDKSVKILEDFFDIAYKYIQVRQNFMAMILQLPNYLKELKPGKIVILSCGRHYNKLGIILNVNYANKLIENSLRILVLDNTVEKNEFYKTELWHDMMSLTREMQYFQPIDVGGHNVIEIKFCQIIDLTKNYVKIEPELIVKNWDQRQIERFKNSPPSQSVQKAVAELYQLNSNFISKKSSLQVISLRKELNMNVQQATELSDLWKKLNKIREEKDSILPYTNIANFQEEFKNVFEKKMIERDIKELSYKNSTKSLSLYPDYRDKLKVLKELSFIDDNEVVHIKGRIACEMAQNELFIIELILSNTFADLDSEEIAALLSGLVFQAKTNIKIIPPTEKIKKAIVHFEEIYHKIETTEMKYNLDSGLENRLNFGLIEAVYEWARKKPFSEITEITDIQEGIIVRCIQQLDETIQDVKTASNRFGNPALKKKMEEASEAIKRDIVFTASLYTSNK